MKECIFCSIQNSGKDKILFEDNLCYVIDDKYPATKGHVLVISKAHHSDFLNTPDKTASHMFLVAKKFGKRLMKKYGATGINIVTNTGRDANQLIMHFHIHVLPRYPGGAEKKSHYPLAGIK